MKTITDFSLPPIQTDQTFVTVSVIEGGIITLPEKCFVSPSHADARRTVPSMAFLIEHPGSNKFGDLRKKSLRLMFDLGLRSNLGGYLPVQQVHLEHRRPYRLGPGVVKHLEAGGLSTADIDLVILSHVHYDHHGDPENFEQSTFIIGPGSLDVLREGISGSKGTHQCFDPNLLPEDRTLELPSIDIAGERKETQNGQPHEWLWAPIGPFPAGIDLFGDSSVYVIDSPGHLPGHINLLCRTAPMKWIYLGGDACHDVRLLTGEKEIGTWENEQGETMCIHLDRAAAEESIRRIRQLMDLRSKNGVEVEIILTHDTVWYEQNRSRMFPNSL